MTFIGMSKFLMDKALIKVDLIGADFLMLPVFAISGFKFPLVNKIYIL